jgi:hypothetical protein
VDREAIARGQRRRQIEEAIEEERERQAALLEQLEEVVTEAYGGRVDEHAFAQMEPEDVALVRVVLEGEPSVDEEEDEADFLSFDEDGLAQAEVEEEVKRLQAEIDESQRRHLAYERYLEALRVATAQSE